MYLGRIVAIGLTKEGNTAAMYRVSSRSFPNREAIKTAQGIAIVPKAGFESDLRKNPYIACVTSHSLSTNALVLPSQKSSHDSRCS